MMKHFFLCCSWTNTFVYTKQIKKPECRGFWDLGVGMMMPRCQAFGFQLEGLSLALFILLNDSTHET